ncbi:MAG TPA: PSD1 and planctomycete cytochrome C domain-containing protein [Bryobacteraceae bacterium]|nr:PSD1 and planctomycete cytochrome C domain-containing protein [Bryobacteraceae bacterium]
MSSRYLRYTLFLIGGIVLAASGQSQTTKRPDFDADILPLLRAKCAGCHGDKMQARELKLSTAEDIAKGSEHGPVVIPGNPAGSLLYKVLQENRMPPEPKDRLAANEIALIRDWIAAGVSYGKSIQTVSFEMEILPFLKGNCGGCHSGKVPKRSLDLTSVAGVIKGSESGDVITPGKPDRSLLYKMLHEGRMPPGGKSIPDKMLASIRDWISSGAHFQDANAAAAAKPVSQHDVLPILYLRCTVCHGLRRQEGGLDLRTRASMLAGGKSGPAIVSGKPKESLLISKVETGAMPPVKMMLDVSVRPITSAETAIIAKWIEQGAPEVPDQPDVATTESDVLVTDKDRQFWSFQPARRPALPQVKHSPRVRNPIDAFILQKLEAKGLPLSPEADRLALIRRVYYDLIGLPPQPKEIQSFIADLDPQAYEKLVERLLGSPRYGERWGRYWLDAAGYSDSEGKLNSDPIRPGAFRYRDYVIRAFNSDKPYDRFLLEQIAGDELADYENAPAITQEIMDNLIATGFLRMAADATQQRDMAFIDDRYEVIGDQIDILGSSVMGLTVKCARCHSHKYDPIPQRDYYRLADVFKGAFDEHDWLPPDLDRGSMIKSRGLKARYLPYVTPGATPMQLLNEQLQNDARKTELAEKIKEAQDLLKEQEADWRKKILAERLADVPEAVREDVRAAVEATAAKRTESQKYLVKKFSKLVDFDAKQLRALSPEFRREAEESEKKVKLLQAMQPPEPVIRALWDRGNPSPTYILRRGSSTSFGPKVGPGVPSVLTDGKTPFVATPPWPGAPKTGRRLALANWLVRAEHPLTARVMVNRIWRHHFGEGLVKSIGNFGIAGTPPSHPELLDWLATEFVAKKWSVKSMHRLMLSSSVYRQSSRITPVHEKLDLDNTLLSRMPMRRMDGEALYDSMLQAAGRLDETPFGAASPVYVREDGSVTPIASEKGWRRSIYTVQRRKDTPTILASFDFPAMEPNCLTRSESTVATQALYLMNDSMVRELAALFAKRVLEDVGGNAAAQVERMYWIGLSRPPDPTEKKLTIAALEQLRSLSPEAALTKVCHSLLNTAAFLYID